MTSASNIAGAYITVGIVPLSPYRLISQAQSALLLSVAITLLALLVFVYLKRALHGAKPIRSAFQTMLIGGLAAAAAFAIARAIS